MENAALIVLLESILGKGQSTSKGNYAFNCPLCTHHKPKLEINLKTNAKKENPWHCWICDSKGKTIRSLFKAIKAPSNKLSELKLIIQPGAREEYTTHEAIELPKEFIPLSNLTSQVIKDKVAHIESKHAFRFLKQRGIMPEDIIKYNIGFCNDGPYGGRVIIPSYDDNGKLNYFIARDYKGLSPRKYKNPPMSVKDIIGFELYINWNAPIILCEGMFDALTIKRNVIPLFGKVLHQKLMTKLVKSEVDKIYIALDKDAIKDALKHCEKLMSYGKQVYLVEMEGKDANEIGFESFLNTIENTYPLTFHGLLAKKLESI
jgi:DNA primase